MKANETWRYIHSERTALAEAMATLTPEQWAAASWCAGWSTRDVAGHVLAAAEQTFPNFYRELAAAGFKFNVFADAGIAKRADLSSEQLVARLRQRTSTTNHPPAPVMAMLGEVIAHGDDIRRPLGLQHRAPDAALVGLADSWKNSNLLIGAKRRITGVRLEATDLTWSHGAGPVVSGPLQSLVLAMVGRKGVHADLTGEGVAVLAQRP